MRVGEESFSLDAASTKGRALPDWYIDEPELEGWDSFYMRSFDDLNTCRNSGFGLSPIAWTDILTYAVHKELDKDLQEAFIQIIRQMDQSFMEYQTEKSEKSKKSKPKST